jgi:hypothetical protein
MTWESAAETTAEVYDRAPALGNAARLIREGAAR